MIDCRGLGWIDEGGEGGGKGGRGGRGGGRWGERRREGVKDERKGRR